MKKWFPKPPKSVYHMDMSADGRYVYALGQTVYALDRQTGMKQRLPQLGNSEPVASPCGRFMAAAHPCRTSQNHIEVSVWQTGETHTEPFPRVRIPSQTPPSHPCFTADGAYFLLDAKPVDLRASRRFFRLWAVSTADGTARMLYDAPEGMCIQSISTGERGVMVALQRFIPADKAACMLVWFRSPDVPPVEIPCRGMLPRSAEQSGGRELAAAWQPDERILLTWTGRDTALQWIDPETDHITPAAEHMLPWGNILGLRFSPDGRYAVMQNSTNGHFTPQVGDRRQAVLVFRTSDWELVWHRNTGFLWDARFSPDGQWLLISGDEGWIVPVEEFAGI